MQLEFATAARVVVGRGTRERAAPWAREVGQRALVVSGKDVSRSAWLLDQLTDAGLSCEPFQVVHEPSVEVADAAAERARAAGCELVVGVGGGSVLDAAKAIAALLANGGSALDYVEVVGRGLPLRARSLPFVAIPTTAGTGSEVTKNAVLGVPAQRVKVSMRGEGMLPSLALVDPGLTDSMPPAVTASTGLDALTHLIESYVSTHANPLTDALCRDGVRRAAGALRRAYFEGTDRAARDDMALVSLFGGMSLANARLGAVHGFAGPVGGMFDGPHGCLCGRFLPHVIEANVRALEQRQRDSPALGRYAEVAMLLTGNGDATPADAVTWIQALCAELPVPPLSHYGATAADIDEMVAKARQASSMKGNPIVLHDDELRHVARQAL
jgi:alcohol dehydrogenase class IV